MTRFARAAAPSPVAVLDPMLLSLGRAQGGLARWPALTEVP